MCKWTQNLNKYVLQYDNKTIKSFKRMVLIWYGFIKEKKWIMNYELCNFSINIHFDHLLWINLNFKKGLSIMSMKYNDKVTQEPTQLLDLYIISNELCIQVQFSTSWKNTDCNFYKRKITLYIHSLNFKMPIEDENKWLCTLFIWHNIFIMPKLVIILILKMTPLTRWGNLDFFAIFPL